MTKFNLALREQLEQSQRTNESLTNDLQKLAVDWQQMRDEMLEKEEEWKEEEQVGSFRKIIKLHFGILRS